MLSILHVDHLRLTAYTHETLNMCTLRQYRNQHAAAVQVYKAITNLTPPYLASMFEYVHETHESGTRLVAAV